MSGLSVAARGDGAVFQSVGFRPGDVVVRVDGRAVSSAVDAQALEARLKPGSRLSVLVERGAQTVPLTIVLPNP